MTAATGPSLLADSPHDALVSWGDRVLPEAPAFRRERQTPQAAAGQVGYGVERLGAVRLGDSRSLLVLQHAHRPGALPLPPGCDGATAAAISMASHGLSFVTVRRGRTSGLWSPLEPASAPHNRRVHAGTVCKVTGPAAGDPRLRTSGDPTGSRVRGTLGNRAGTTTPWGQVLAGEGRVSCYFDASGPVGHGHAESFWRYGLGAGDPGWGTADPRFDLSREPHEAYRFGWVVQIDPWRPGAKPRKLTMLGRLSHRSLEAGLSSDRRALVRLVDGGTGGRHYAFVSRDPVDHRPGPVAAHHNRGLLSAGILYLADAVGVPGESKVSPSGWVPLASETTSYVAGMSVADVLLDTRLAADRALPAARIA